MEWAKLHMGQTVCVDDAVRAPLLIPAHIRARMDASAAQGCARAVARPPARHRSGPPMASETPQGRAMRRMLTLAPTWQPFGTRRVLDGACR
jgi:hypothetical protein